MRAVADESWLDPSAKESGAEKNFVRFELHPKRNEAKSVEAGRPIFDDVEYVEIGIPGDKSTIVHRPVTDFDRRTYARQYAAFKANQDQDAASGTPLEAAPWLTRAQVEELRFFKCRTVEQLAAMPDSNAQRFPGIQDLKRKATKFLEAAASDAPRQQFEAELAKRDNDIAVLKRQLEEAVATIGEMKRAKK